jgi:threonine/homoserine/homoserine lactone efflux protein
MLDAQLLAFVAVALVITLTPGPDMALVLRNTVRGGRSAGLETVAGIAVGLVLWAGATAAGLAALIAASSTVFTALKLVGAIYLVYLGSQALLAARRGNEPEPPRRSGAPFRQALVTNLLNPKLALLFTTLLPQFVADDDPAAKPLLLATVFITIGLTWLVTYTHLVEALARRRRFAQLADAVAGVVLVALGARLLVDR